MTIEYVTGDLFDGINPDEKQIIAHVCNNAGGWGRGFTGALSRYSEEPEQAYRHFAANHPLVLGKNVTVWLSPKLTVCHMIAQDGYSRPGTPAIRYAPLELCLRQLAEIAAEGDAAVLMPKIGCGLAGGSWPVVSELIEEELRGISVRVYSLTP